MSKYALCRMSHLKFSNVQIYFENSSSLQAQNVSQGYILWACRSSIFKFTKCILDWNGTWMSCNNNSLQSNLWLKFSNKSSGVKVQYLGPRCSGEVKLLEIFK